MGMERFKLGGTSEKAVRVLRGLANPKYAPEESRIPLTLLRHAEGVVFLTVFKAGLFMLGGNVGGGCVIAKVYDSSGAFSHWSAPSSVGCGGLGGGFVFGGEYIESLIILNTKSAVRSFMGKAQVTFGGDLSIAAGPVGRDLSANVGLSDNKEIVAAYSYSRSKGAYIGATLEGAIMLSRPSDNFKFYNDKNATPERVLSGAVSVPYGPAQNLIDEMAQVCSRVGDYADDGSGTSLAKSESASESGRKLLRQAVSSSSRDHDDELWEEMRTEAGEVYYYNTVTGKTAWEKPSKSTPPAAAARIRKSAHAYTAVNSDELSFPANADIEIIDQSVGADWWLARYLGEEGLVPVNHLAAA